MVRFMKPAESISAKYLKFEYLPEDQVPEGLDPNQGKLCDYVPLYAPWSRNDACVFIVIEVNGGCPEPATGGTKRGLLVVLSRTMAASNAAVMSEEKAATSDSSVALSSGIWFVSRSQRLSSTIPRQAHIELEK